MFSHIMLGTDNLAESITFYDHVMPALGHSRQDTGDTYAGYGSDIVCLWIGVPCNGKPATAGNGVNVALLANTRQQVDQFYNAALQSGGTDEGAPGVRKEVHDNFYAAYMRDPTGNKLVVVCHAEQSTE